MKQANTEMRSFILSKQILFVETASHVMQLAIKYSTSHLYLGVPLFVTYKEKPAYDFWCSPNSTRDKIYVRDGIDQSL
jgi:hypothetical protein